MENNQCADGFVGAFLISVHTPSLATTVLLRDIIPRVLDNDPFVRDLGILWAALLFNWV